MVALLNATVWGLELAANASWMFYLAAAAVVLRSASGLALSQKFMSDLFHFLLRPFGLSTDQIQSARHRAQRINTRLGAAQLRKHEPTEGKCFERKDQGTAPKSARHRRWGSAGGKMRKRLLKRGSSGDAPDATGVIDASVVATQAPLLIPTSVTSAGAADAHDWPVSAQPRAL